MQHVAPKNVAICLVGMLRSFGRGLKQKRVISLEDAILNVQQQQCDFQMATTSLIYLKRLVYKLSYQYLA